MVIDTVAANYHYKLSTTCVCLMNSWQTNIYLICGGIEMSFVRMLTFGIHVSVDAH